MEFFENIIKILDKYHMLYLEGLWGTLWISVVVVLCGTVLGTLVALCRMSRSKLLNGIMFVYIELIRGTPILVQLYFFWLALPKIMPFELNDTQSIIIALVISTAAYIAEIIRAGIGAVDKGQWEAAKSIGLSTRNTMTRVILPQAVKNILPALGNEFISTVKGTSLASIFFLGELTTAYKTAGAATFLQVESLTIAAVIYFTVNFILSRLLKVLERRLTVSD